MRKAESKTISRRQDAKLKARQSVGDKTQSWKQDQSVGDKTQSWKHDNESETRHKAESKTISWRHKVMNKLREKLNGPSWKTSCTHREILVTSWAWKAIYIDPRPWTCPTLQSCWETASHTSDHMKTKTHTDQDTECHKKGDDTHNSITSIKQHHNAHKVPVSTESYIIF